MAHSQERSTGALAGPPADRSAVLARGFAGRALALAELADEPAVREGYNPRPGLVAGTCAGATVGIAVGARIIERPESEGCPGRAGRIARLGRRVAALRAVAKGWGVRC